MPYLQNATDFLIQSLIGFALYLVVLRFLMQWLRADFRNQFGQSIISISNPLILPLRRILPSIRMFDTATLMLAYALGLVKIFAFVALRSEASIPLINYLIWGVGLLFKYSIHLFLVAVFIQVIASWINPHSHHPILSVANSIAQPLLAPAQRLIPTMGGIDFSPILVILLLQFSLRLIVAPLLPLPI